MKTRERIPPLTAQQQDLVTSHVRLAYYLAHHGPGRSFVPQDERKSEALYALCRAAAYYDSQRGPFDKLVRTVVLRHLKEVAYHYRRWQAKPFTDVKSRSQALADMQMDARCHRTPRPETSVDNADLLARVRSTLSPEAFSILWEHYGLSMPMREIALRRGVSQQAIFERENKLRRSLCRRFPGFVGGGPSGCPTKGRHQQAVEPVRAEVG
jgi:hypothetical protein